MCRSWYIWTLTGIIGLVFFKCGEPPTTETSSEVFITVLGIAQDAGYPQAACRKICCSTAWQQPEFKRMVSSLALVDRASGRHWIIDASPDFKDQLALIPPMSELSGIFLTHAHMGHYTGLIHLGREAMGSRELPVYAMARMRNFLENNGPWDQLVSLANIELRTLKADSTVILSPGLAISPVKVPHRDEYSETVGYYIQGPRKTVLYIPDIDKWDKWHRNVKDEITKVDLAFIDGSFYQEGELPDRDMSAIPHPFITETQELLRDLELSDRSKVHFIHLNHTNPLLQESRGERQFLEKEGFQVARQGASYPL